MSRRKDIERAEKGIRFREGKLTTGELDKDAEKLSSKYDAIPQGVKTKVLDGLVGRFPQYAMNPLMRALKVGLPSQFKDWQKHGKPLTMETAEAEVDNTPGFLSTYEKAGITRDMILQEVKLALDKYLAK